ncbi:hypothetical protein [uncultured Helicobacter sp.]|uniref:hypothetical protein n=1 Tax=uncultured Helicobacter sp. TaxID=175537 RepID=UPI002631480C|nr:hypothetical protein [uncultured Helicobacter sp.]
MNIAQYVNGIAGQAGTHEPLFYKAREDIKADFYLQISNVDSIKCDYKLYALLWERDNEGEPQTFDIAEGEIERAQLEHGHLEAFLDECVSNAELEPVRFIVVE